MKATKSQKKIRSRAEKFQDLLKGAVEDNVFLGWQLAIAEQWANDQGIAFRWRETRMGINCKDLEAFDESGRKCGMWEGSVGSVKARREQEARLAHQMMHAEIQIAHVLEHVRQDVRVDSE